MTSAVSHVERPYGDRSAPIDHLPLKNSTAVIAEDSGREDESLLKASIIKSIQPFDEELIRE